jgi:transposase
MHKRCAGLDVHKKTVTACRRDGKHQEVKTFGTTTPDLLELVDWLLEWECTHVAMESTGDYWKPIYNLLEGSFQVLLVNAKHVKHVPGRKTDVGDAQWLAELMQYGLLKASFIPPAPQRDLRDLTRYRTKQVQDRAREVKRVQKVLETANIKLSSVATDVLGVSGRAMLEAIVAGQSDPETMAQLAKGRMRSKLPELEKALTGVVRDHHRFLLAQQLVHIDFLDEHISRLSAEIEHRIHEMSQTQDHSPLPRGQASRNVDSETEYETPEPPSFEKAVELLDTIPGIDKLTAELIVAELGVDMNRFPTAKHAAAWAGLAPGNNESGGKRRSGRTKKGNRALRSGLLQAAWAASRTKNTYLSAQYSRLAGRRGKKRAIVAVAHSILVMSYHILKRQQPYKELGGNYFDERKKESILHGLVKRISKLGYEVSLEPTAA